MSKKSNGSIIAEERNPAKQVDKRRSAKQVEKRRRWEIQMNALNYTATAVYIFDKPVRRPFNFMDMDPMPSTEACRDYYRDARRAFRRLANALVVGSTNAADLVERAIDRVLKASTAFNAQNYRKEYTFGETPFEKIAGTIDEVLEYLNNGKLAYYTHIHIEWPRFPRVEYLPAEDKCEIVPGYSTPIRGGEVVLRSPWQRRGASGMGTLPPTIVRRKSA